MNARRFNNRTTDNDVAKRARKFLCSSSTFNACIYLLKHLLLRCSIIPLNKSFIVNSLALITEQSKARTNVYCLLKPSYIKPFTQYPSMASIADQSIKYLDWYVDIPENISADIFRLTRTRSCFANKIFRVFLLQKNSKNYYTYNIVLLFRDDHVRPVSRTLTCSTLSPTANELAHLGLRSIIKTQHKDKLRTVSTLLGTNPCVYLSAYNLVYINMYVRYVRTINVGHSANERYIIV